MKTLMLILLTLNLVLTTKAQESLETFLFESKSNLEIAAKISNSASLNTIYTMRTDIGPILRMSWFMPKDINSYDCRYIVYLEYGSKIKTHFNGTRSVTKKRFLVTLEENSNGQERKMFFGHNQNNQGGYFISTKGEGRQPLLNPIPGIYSDFVRPMTSREINHFDSLVTKIVSSFRIKTRNH